LQLFKDGKAVKMPQSAAIIGVIREIRGQKMLRSNNKSVFKNIVIFDPNDTVTDFF
jgi:hypothetical protein